MGCKNEMIYYDTMNTNKIGRSDNLKRKTYSFKYTVLLPFDFYLYIDRPL